MNDDRKKIEIVPGTGKNLEISDVSTHLNVAKPKTTNQEEKKQEIVIPQAKKKNEEEQKKS